LAWRSVYTIAYSQPDIVNRDVLVREEVCLGHEDPNGLLEKAHRYQRAEAICGTGNVKKGVFVDDRLLETKITAGKIRCPIPRF
jgi:hypothetical protein